MNPYTDYCPNCGQMHLGLCVGMSAPVMPTPAIGAEHCMQVFSAEITTAHPDEIQYLCTSPNYHFKGIRLCVTKNINKFRIANFQVGIYQVIDIDLPAIMFPVLPDFKDCKIPNDFEKKVADLLKIDYQTCNPGQKMKLGVRNISKKQVSFEAVMHGIRTFQV